MPLLDLRIIMNEDLQDEIVKLLPNLEVFTKDERVIAVLHYASVLRLIGSGLPPGNIFQLDMKIRELEKQIRRKDNETKQVSV